LKRGKKGKKGTDDFNYLTELISCPGPIGGELSGGNGSDGFGFAGERSIFVLGGTAFLAIHTGERPCGKVASHKIACDRKVASTARPVLGPGKGR
jgi:hypothetical protein